jgi:CheY-like chemotaxis protein
MKFLFIEDDRRFFEWLCEVLPGHECVRASRMSEVIEILSERQDFDAIFVDQIIPGEESVKLLSAAKGLADGIPTIILTGEAMRIDLCRVADGLVFKHEIMEHPDIFVPRYVDHVTQKIRDEGPMEQTKKLFSAIGGLRHGIPA